MLIFLRLALSLLGVVVDTMVAGYTDRRRLLVFHASFLHIMWAAIFALSFWRAYHTIPFILCYSGLSRRSALRLPFRYWHEHRSQ